MMLALTILSLPFLAAAAVWTIYLLIVTAAGAAHVCFDGRRACVPAKNDSRPDFLVVIPAHDEAANIASCVRSVLVTAAKDGASVDVLVIADNCTDDTATIAFAAGARVWKRADAERRGKGYALEDMATRELARAGWDWILVLDADTHIAPGSFNALERRIASGAQAIQAHYGARVAERSWRTDLLQTAWALFNYLRPLGRTQLGGTAGIFGNGFALSRAVVQEFPFQSHSLVEDAEHGLELLLRGVRVEFEKDARVSGLVEATSNAARSQRVRWESGRAQLARKFAPLLARKFATSPRWRYADALLDVATPPLALVVCSTLLAGVLSIVAGAKLVALTAAALLLLQTLMVFTGAAMSGLGLRGVAAIAWAPFYVLWKLSLYVTPGFWRQKTWVRTQRTAA